MSQLLVTLPAPETNQAELAYALIASNGALTSHGRATPALLPKADTATLIVPAQAIAWHAAAMPKMQRGMSAAKQLAIFSGVLEEQLLDDPAQTHLAACPSISPNGTTWVAAVNKAWLQSAVAALQAARVPLTRIVPQAFPSEAVQLHVSGTSDAAWLTFADAQGVLCLPLAQVAQGALLPELPEGLAITAEPAVAAGAEHVLGQRANVLQAAQWALQSAQSAQASGVDLAQGELALSGGGRAWQTFTGFFGDVLAAPAWGPVRWGMLLLLLANLIGLNAWSYKQSAQIAEKRAQMNQLLTQSFPNVKVVVDAPLQMQRELAILRQAQGQLSGRDFESIYGRFSGIAGINVAPDAIEYVANEVQIRGSGLQASQLDALLARLQYAGLAVRSDAQALIVSHQDASRAAAAPRAGAKP